jgi:hypothetical protein
LFSFRYAQISAYNGGRKIANWREISLFVLGCGISTLAVIRVYRVLMGDSDATATVVLSLAWTVIGVLIGWYIGYREAFEKLLRK